MPLEDVAVCVGGEARVAGAGVALAGRVLCVGVAGAGARAGAVGGPEGDAADWGGGVCLNVTIIQLALVTLVREQKVEAVKRGHALKNPHVGLLPPVELTSEIFCCITH